MRTPGTVVLIQRGPATRARHYCVRQAAARAILWAVGPCNWLLPYAATLVRASPAMRTVQNAYSFSFDYRFRITVAKLFIKCSDGIAAAPCQVLAYQRCLHEWRTQGRGRPSPAQGVHPQKRQN